MHPSHRKHRHVGRLAAASAALALALGGCIGQSTTPSPPLDGATAPPTYLPLTVKNNSTHTVFVQFTGNSMAVSPASGQITAGKSATFNVTTVSAGRMYLSYDTALSSDAPDGANPHDPDYHTRFDKVEISYTHGAGGNANLTAVDFYAIPLVLETSIQSTTIDHLTFAAGQTGTALKTALSGAVAAGQTAPVVNTASGAFARILSPVKAPASYAKFDTFVATLTTPTQFAISGTYFGTPSESYDYTGSMTGDVITLTNAAQTHTITIKRSTLDYSATDLVAHNGIYTCDAPFIVDGAAHDVAGNDIYAAVYRDLVAGFNLGFVRAGVTNTSSAWWTEPAFPTQNAPASAYYNAYAQQVATVYPGAYGFPFSDRYRQVLASLGGMIDGVTVTVLDDDTAPASYTPTGNINPQSGTGPTFNMSLTTSDNNFNNTTFTFDTQTYQGGTNVNFPTTPTPFTAPNTSAVIGSIPTQEGLNIYSLVVRGYKYRILANVKNNTIEWASIAGGGNATWSGGVLYVGGLN
ncbi:MAG: hypothetical protein JSR18_04925 [Proteobacteria bacterium]|nr:hypothetical protein [Pseudomonadota bacterium]